MVGMISRHSRVVAIVHSGYYRTLVALAGYTCMGCRSLFELFLDMRTGKCVICKIKDEALYIVLADRVFAKVAYR